MEPLTLPLVPVIVRVYDPTGVVDVVVTARVDVAELPEVSVTDAGVKPAVLLLGTPLALIATVPERPPVDVIVTV